ncbi:hypothetical protein H8E77_02310, partial [bacterium]|nr:hypothetical protein [bacterium]
MKKYFVTTLVCLVLVASVAYGAIIIVPPGTIQEAIDTAVDGDTVLVADGVYIGEGNKNLDFGGKAITVTSENGAENCIIDCEGDGRGFIFQTNEGETSVVSGFTITNGFDSYVGAGIYCYDSDPTIQNCTITGNRGARGGGICCSGLFSDPTITNCILWDDSPKEICIFAIGNPVVTYSDIQGRYPGEGN